ncbi:phosphoribosylglycinamide formyltransferase, partial [Streptomyces formicae]
MAKSAVVARPKRLVVLVSGSGTNLQALIDTIGEEGARGYGAEIVAVGADRDDLGSV